MLKECHWNICSLKCNWAWRLKQKKHPHQPTLVCMFYFVWVVGGGGGGGGQLSRNSNTQDELLPGNTSPASLAQRLVITKILKAGINVDIRSSLTFQNWAPRSAAFSRYRMRFANASVCADGHNFRLICEVSRGGRHTEKHIIEHYPRHSYDLIRLWKAHAYTNSSNVIWQVISLPLII